MTGVVLGVSCLFLVGVCFPAVVWARAVLENPKPGSFQSGLGVISGWACDAQAVEISFNDGPRSRVGSGTVRGDTADTCGDTDNGFGLLFNWNLLGDGTHTVTAYTDGVEFASVTVIVTTLGQEFLSGNSYTFPLPDFPTSGATRTLRWSEAQQNFVITADSPQGGGTSMAARHMSENPPQHFGLSDFSAVSQEGVLAQGGGGSGGGAKCTIGFSTCRSAAYHAVAEGPGAGGEGWCLLWGIGSSQAAADQDAYDACQANSCTCRVTAGWEGDSCLARAESSQLERYAWAASTGWTEAEIRAMELCRQSEDGGDEDGGDEDGEDEDGEDEDGGNQGGGAARHMLENPKPGSFQSGLGVISGWACDAQAVEISFNDGPRSRVGSGTIRGDTASTCGDTDNGFGLLFNWNLLGAGTHTVTAYTDGVEFASVTVTVTTLGQEFLRDASYAVTLPDFPEAGTDVRAEWQEAQQNFVIVGMAPTQRLVRLIPRLVLPAGIRWVNPEISSLYSSGVEVPASPKPSLVVAIDGPVWNGLFALANQDGGLLGEAAGTVEISVESTVVRQVIALAGIAAADVTPAIVDSIRRHPQYASRLNEMTARIQETFPETAGFVINNTPTELEWQIAESIVAGVEGRDRPPAIIGGLKVPTTKTDCYYKYATTTEKFILSLLHRVYPVGDAIRSIEALRDIPSRREAFLDCAIPLRDEWLAGGKWRRVPALRYGMGEDYYQVLRWRAHVVRECMGEAGFAPLFQLLENRLLKRLIIGGDFGAIFSSARWEHEHVTWEAELELQHLDSVCTDVPGVSLSGVEDAGSALYQPPQPDPSHAATEHGLIWCPVFDYGAGEYPAAGVCSCVGPLRWDEGYLADACDSVKLRHPLPYEGNILHPGGWTPNDESACIAGLESDRDCWDAEIVGGGEAINGLTPSY